MADYLIALTTVASIGVGIWIGFFLGRESAYQYVWQKMEERRERNERKTMAEQSKEHR